MLKILYFLAKPISSGSIGSLLTIIEILVGICIPAGKGKQKKILVGVVIALAIIFVVLSVNFIYMDRTYTEVPNVMGLQYFDAVKELNTSSLLYVSPKTDDSVLVAYQYPAPETIVQKHSYIDLYCVDKITQEPALFNYYFPEKNDITIVEVSLRQLGEKGLHTWRKSIVISMNDEFEVQIHYRNKLELNVLDVMVRFVLPQGVEYVPDSVTLFNTTNPDGIKCINAITTTGVNIGGYTFDGDGYVRFKCFLTSIPNNNSNTFVIWGQVDSHVENYKTVQDYAEIKCLT